MQNKSTYQTNLFKTLPIVPCLHNSEMTYDNLFKDYDTVYEGLKEAFRLSRKGKTHTVYVQEFENYLGKNLNDLATELLTQSYKPQPIREFTIFCHSGQKTRKILAPAFRDIVVQRYVYEKIYYLFDKDFIYHSFGCRRNKGGHKCSKTIQKWQNSSNPNNYYLQLDVRKFYYNIDHTILRTLIQQKIKDEKLLNLLISFCTPNSDVGVNVGSVLAQLFALIYLDALDQHVKHVLKIKKYARYVDDILIMNISKERAISLHNYIEKYLYEHLKLELSKFKINKLCNGINFTGVRTFYHYNLTRPRTYKNFYREVKAHENDINFKSIESRLGMIEHTNSYIKLIEILNNNINTKNIIPKHILRRIYKWQKMKQHLQK